MNTYHETTRSRSRWCLCPSGRGSAHCCPVITTTAAESPATATVTPASMNRRAVGLQTAIWWQPVGRIQRSARDCTAKAGGLDIGRAPRRAGLRESVPRDG
jgi:hypothetical protein